RRRRPHPGLGDREEPAGDRREDEDGGDRHDSPPSRGLGHHAPGGAQGWTALPSRCSTAKLLAATPSQGPTVPSGHWTRTCARSASPRPKWIQPSCPPAWPPPTVTSCCSTRSPTLTSTHDPTASTFGAGCSS